MGAKVSEPQHHALFRRYPLTTLKRTSQGPLPVPYHIYDGYALLIGGTADLPAVRQRIAGEDVHPISTTDGRALMCIWVVDGTDASLGPHQELQFSILVAHKPLPAVPVHPLAILDLLLHNPDARLLCHGLWNNTAAVVAYNREVLALNARLMQGTILAAAEGQRSFTFADANGADIFSGSVREAAQTAPKLLPALLRLMGVGGMLQGGRESVLAAQVVNTKGILPFNADAQAYMVGATQVLQYLDPATDKLTFSDPHYAALDFRGQFLEHITGFKFVYLNIHDAGDVAYRGEGA